MKHDRNWKPNAGKRATPRDPEKKVWLRFRAIDPYSGKPYESTERVRAGNYNWSDRGGPFDIMEASDDPE